MKQEINVIGVIPARYASVRLPYKLLRKIRGKSLLQRTWENATDCHALDDLIIACDHQALYEEARKIGAKAVLTSLDHTSGTDRIAEAVSNIEAKIIINIQADEPLMHPSAIDSLAQEMLLHPDLAMTTVKTRINDALQINDPAVVKVVCDCNGFALYFSRCPIPCDRDRKGSTYYKHLGVYAYTKDFLYTFKNLPPSKLEETEKLEQLRALEAGCPIKVIETKFDSWGVDTERDLLRVEEILIEKGNG
ncbi:MAG: 3-deoxy-manno-octulosonate cytidylyltransferase [Candidatus Omnitrophota bacterium]|jgi:3-deoxy-manno-octulosonate cytidylyltransferase (CMP-KDO synthetase)